MLDSGLADLSVNSLVYVPPLCNSITDENNNLHCLFQCSKRDPFDSEGKQYIGTDSERILGEVLMSLPGRRDVVAECMARRGGSAQALSMAYGEL